MQCPSRCSAEPGPQHAPPLVTLAEPVADARPIGYITGNAPVAQLDRALPSEGKGHTFESCRVRQFSLFLQRDIYAGTSHVNLKFAT